MTQDLTLPEIAGRSILLHSRKIEDILDQAYQDYAGGTITARELQDWIKLQLRIYKVGAELTRGPEVTVEVRDDVLTRKIRTTIKSLTPDERKQLARLAQGVSDGD